MATRIQFTGSFDADGNPETVEIDPTIQTKKDFADAGGTPNGGAQINRNAGFQRVQQGAPNTEHALETLQGTVNEYRDLQKIERQLGMSGKSLNPAQTEKMGQLFRDITLQASGIPGALEELGIEIDD